MGENFIIPLNGLAAGKSTFSWQADKEFFERFDNSEILGAHFEADIAVEKSGQYIGVDCNVDGHVVVECDRCLEELQLPVNVEIRLSVKYGEVSAEQAETESGREVVSVPSACAELDMSQIIYDYICLSLPMQRVHLPGKCNPEAVKHIGFAEASGTENSENPFGILKDLLNRDK